MANEQPNTCEILSADATVGEFRRDFVCLNDSLHESLQDHPHVLMLYVAMVIFVMVFLKMVTRKPRGGEAGTPATPPQAGNMAEPPEKRGSDAG